MLDQNSGELVSAVFCILYSMTKALDRFSTRSSQLLFMKDKGSVCSRVETERGELATCVINKTCYGICFTLVDYAG